MAERLPDDIHRELVQIMFTALPPIIVIGVMATIIAGVVAAVGNDPAEALFAVAGVMLTVVRVGIVLGYRHETARAPLTLAQETKWERRYASGSYCIALLIGAVGACALTTKASLIHMLVSSLLFGYGAGLVTRVAVRPVICIISLFLAVIPTVGGLVIHFFTDDVLSAALYGVEAIMIVIFSVASLETVKHGYTNTVQHLLTRRELARQADHDILTELPNRLLLRKRLEKNLDQVDQQGGIVAVHALDLDQFKAVNDRFGHPVGDALLQAVAARLKGMVAAHDTVARLGGDEFVVVQTGIQYEDQARLLAQRIICVISASYGLGDKDVQIGVSVGIALAPRDGRKLEPLLACADHALYSAKHKGRGRVVLSGIEGLVAAGAP